MTSLDLAAVGIGPFNLALAALAAPVPELSLALFDRRPEFRWHPGLLLDEATLQVPFLADLVSLVDPTSPFSFLNYLRAHDRLFPFYFAERFHVPRREFDHYARWVAESLPSCRFGVDVRTVRHSPADAAFRLESADGTVITARNVVLGTGSVPHVPDALRAAVADPTALAVHSADYLPARERLLAAESVTVVGSGQSGAEIVLDLLRHRPRPDGLRWLTRSESFAPMEYSKLGLEQFTPDYAEFFADLPPAQRDDLLPRQNQLYKGIDAETIAAIHDELYRRAIAADWPPVRLTPGVTVRAAHPEPAGLRLDVRHDRQGRAATLRTHALVAATGHAEADTTDLLGDLPRRDAAGRLVVTREHRLSLRADVPGAIFVQNVAKHSHGVGTPDLGLAAWRSASILNAVLGRPVYRLPARTAFTSFGLPADRPDREEPS